MRLNKTGIALFLFFGLGGLAFVIAGVLIPMPAEGRFTFVLLGGIWVLVVVGLILYARREDKKAGHQDWVFKTGSAAPPPCSTPAATRPSTRCR
jgi:hypothetical protein